MSFDWNATNVELMRNLLAKGCSCGAVASVLGTSRNAVIGKATRMGIMDRRHSAGSKVGERRNPRRSDGMATPPPPAPEHEAPPKPKRIGAPVTIGTVQHGQCRFPLEHASASMRLCGEPCSPLEPYCADCRRKAFAPASRKAKEAA